MKRWKQILEAMALAMTYAEAGDWQSAREFLNETNRPSRPNQVDQHKRRQKRPRATIYRG